MQPNTPSGAASHPSPRGTAHHGRPSGWPGCLRPSCALLDPPLPAMVERLWAQLHGTSCPFQLHLLPPPPIPILITKKADRRGPERGSDLLKITQCIGPRVGWGSGGSGGAPAEDQMACREESAQQHLCVGLRPPPTSSADEEAGHTANLGRSQPRSLWASKAATHRRGGSLSTLPSTQYALRKCGHTGSTVTRQTRGIQHSCLMPLT